MFKINLKETNPIQQGIFSIALTTFIAMCCLLFGIKSMLVWSILLVPIFLFCCYNPIIGAFKQKPILYTIISAIVLIILGFYSLMIGNYISDFAYKQTVELHLIAVVIIIFYALLQTLCVVFRIILYLLHEVDK